MIDSHCHIDGEAFALDREQVLTRACERGVQALVVPAVGASSWQPILELTARPGLPRTHAALGLHPVSLVATSPGDDDALLARLSALATRERRRLVAIGECGLDAVIDAEKAPMVRQERVLRFQLALARELDLPVVLHGRGHAAYRRLIELLEADGALPAGGVVHSYGGGADLVRRFAALGLYFGFAGPVTYPDARKVRASATAVAADRLLVETDAPDQTPAPHRPERSEPAYLVDVLAGLAAARSEGVDALASLTAANARRLFRLPA
jgi:TatD DNase family protein